MSERLTDEELACVREEAARGEWSEMVVALLAELDAVRAERDRLREAAEEARDDLMHAEAGASSWVWSALDRIRAVLAETAPKEEG